MIEETIEELVESMGKAHEALKRDLGRLRTGRANPEILDTIRVDYYGTRTPLNQMATVTVPEARQLLVKPWDKSTLALIEKAIISSSLNLNPQNDGELIRIPIPMLTEERRKEIVKLAKQSGEDCRISIRKARHEAKDVLQELQKEGEAGEDDVERAMKVVEEKVRGANGVVEEIVSRKERDIMEL